MKLFENKFIKWNSETCFLEMEEVNCAELSFLEVLETCRTSSIMEPGAFVKTARHIGSQTGLLFSYFLLSVTFLNLAKITFISSYFCLNCDLLKFLCWILNAHEILCYLFSNIKKFKAKALPWCLKVPGSQLEISEQESSYLGKGGAVRLGLWVFCCGYCVA